MTEPDIVERGEPHRRFPQRPHFSVGIPVYNEEELLEVHTDRLLRFLESLERPFEVLLGSNGSTDRTVEIAQRLAVGDPRIDAFSIDHRAPGAAFRGFIHRASSPLLISLDMDLSIDLDFVPRALELLEHCDLVVGAKQTGEQKRSWLRRTGSGTFIAVARRCGLPFQDYSMAAKGYRIAALEPHLETLVDGTAYVLYAIAAVQAAGGEVVEIPVDCDDRRRSRFSLPREALHKFFHLARWMWSRPRS